MEDPAAIGLGMAVSILTLFYGILTAFAISVPLLSWLEDRAQEQNGGANGVLCGCKVRERGLNSAVEVLRS